MEGIRAAIADDQSRGTSRSVAARPSPTDIPQPEPSTLLISQMDLPPLKGAAAAPKMVQTKGAPTTFGAADPPRSKGGTMAPSPPKPVLELGKSQPQLHAKQDPQSATSTITSPGKYRRLGCGFGVVSGVQQGGVWVCGDVGYGEMGLEEVGFWEVE